MVDLHQPVEKPELGLRPAGILFMASDYYATLGVSQTATEKEVRAAYRRLARKLHPDVNPNDKASESRFKEVNAAYSVLSDPDKRKKYDVYGDNWEHADEIERQRRTRTRTGGGLYGGPNVDFEEFNFDLGNGGAAGAGDIFGDLFGRRRGGRQRNLNVEQKVEISLEEAYSGTTRTLLVGGQNGSEARRLEVRIPAGVTSGSRVRVAGEGQDGNGRKGDLFLIVEVRPHDVFERKGDDLHMEADVPLTTAVLGGEAEIQAIGRKVALKLPPQTQNGRVFRLAGLGIPHLNSSGKGDLYVKVNVRLPDKIGPEEQTLFEQLKAKGI